MRKKRRSYETTFEIFKSQNCELLITLDEYEEAKEPFKYRCECGNESTIRISDLKRGRRCKECGKNKNKILKQTPFNEIESIFTSEGYKVLSDKNNYDTMGISFACPNGHIGDIRLSHFKNGIRCSTCSYNNRKLHNHSNWTGLTPISSFLRKYINDWKTESFKSTNYLCSITNEPARVVHHLYSFNQIVKETLFELNLPSQAINEYREEDLKNLIEVFVRNHNSYGLGVPLTSEVHRKFHSIYGLKNNTVEQFLEFKSNIEKKGA